MSYIDNVVQGLILASTSENANGQTYWVADKRPYRTLEIYHTVAHILGVKSLKPGYVPEIVSAAMRLADKTL